MYRNIYFTIYFICWFFNLLHAACLYNKETQNVKRENERYNFRIYDHNIRVAGTNLEPFERPWSERKDPIIADMLGNCLKTPTIITVQEALLSQVNDIKNGLNENKGTSWTYFGYGAEDGKQAGKFNPIFYDSNQWTLESGRQEWISLSPYESSFFPKTTEKRIITMVTLIHKATGRRIDILNTQFDDESVAAREVEAMYLESYINRSKDKGHPTIVSGDINCTYRDVPYERIKRSLYDCSQYRNQCLILLLTFTGFSGPEKTIDFVFVDVVHVFISNYEVLDNKFKDGTYRFSTHRAVIVDLYYYS